MVLGLPFAHIPSCFAEDRRSGHDIDAIDLGQVRTGHSKQLRAQAELWRIPFPTRDSQPVQRFGCTTAELNLKLGKRLFYH
jgi:hypothetical protein